MMGRFLGLAAAIAAVSIGMASVAGRPDDGGMVAAAPKAEDHSNWTTQPRQTGGWSSTPGQSAATGDVRLARAADSHFYADVEVDGRRIRMMVDSGASIVALTRRDAETIGIDVDSLPVAGSAATAGGVVSLRPVMLARLSVNGIEARGVQAAVIDADMGVSLLGQSFLSKLDGVNIEGDMMTLR